MIKKTSEGEKISKTWGYEEIKSILPKRNGGRETALEIFFTNGSSVFLDFNQEGEKLENVEERKENIKENILKKGAKRLKNLDNLQIGNPEKWLRIRTALWNKGEITNFQYLLDINQMSGRTFKNLENYPNVAYAKFDK